MNRCSPKCGAVLLGAALMIGTVAPARPATARAAAPQDVPSNVVPDGGFEQQAKYTGKVSAISTCA